MFDSILGSVGGAIKNVGQAISNFDPSNIRKSIAGLTNFTGALGAKTNLSGITTFVNAMNGATAQDDWRMYLIDRDGYLVGKYETFEPLLGTKNGVLFPYTPSISMSYRANYEMVQGVQTNWAIPTYQQSNVEMLTLRATFTANSQSEALYLLTVLHFLRSATKSHFGSDPLAGLPPPILYLNGYGEGMYNNVPVVISSVSYTLPPDVDYIDCGAPNSKAQSQAQNEALTVTRDDEGNVLPGSEQADAARVAARMNIEAGMFSTNTMFKNTKVPTEIDVDINMYVTYRRSDQVKLSTEDYYTGDLVKKGFL